MKNNHMTKKREVWWSIIIYEPDQSYQVMLSFSWSLLGFNPTFSSLLSLPLLLLIQKVSSVIFLLLHLKTEPPFSSFSMSPLISLLCLLCSPQKTFWISSIIHQPLLPNGLAPLHHQDSFIFQKHPASLSFSMPFKSFFIPQVPTYIPFPILYFLFSFFAFPIMVLMPSWLHHMEKMICIQMVMHGHANVGPRKNLGDWWGLTEV